MVTRVVKPERLHLTSAEFMAMSQNEVEKYWNDNAPADPEAQPQYWGNVAVLMTRNLRKRMSRWQELAVAASICCVLMFVLFVLAVAGVVGG